MALIRKGRGSVLQRAYCYEKLPSSDPGLLLHGLQITVVFQSITWLVLPCKVTAPNFAGKCSLGECYLLSIALCHGKAHVLSLCYEEVCHLMRKKDHSNIKGTYVARGQSWWLENSDVKISLGVTESLLEWMFDFYCR